MGTQDLKEIASNVSGKDIFLALALLGSASSWIVLPNKVENNANEITQNLEQIQEIRSSTGNNRVVLVRIEENLRHVALTLSGIHEEQIQMRKDIAAGGANK